MARRLLWASLALAPITLVVDATLSPDEATLFVFSAISLVPLAWLIGEATENAGEYTGPRIGGLLNASFGNAPELIIALCALSNGLPNVVRGSVTGSIVSNLLLVLGLAVVFGIDNAEVDRRSLWLPLGLVFVAVFVLLIPSIPGWHGDPNRHSLALLSIAPAIVLLVAYLVVTTQGVRGSHSVEATLEQPWPLRTALFALGVATVLTAAVSEVLVHSLAAFARAAHLSEFFISVVIVAIVGNAAEHGGAIVIARRGKMKLASEIAISSSAQVGLLVVPAVVLLSFAFSTPLTLAFRPVELATIAVAAVVVAIVIKDDRAQRWEGALLIGVYLAMVVVFGVSGDRGG